MNNLQVRNLTSLTTTTAAITTTTTTTAATTTMMVATATKTLTSITNMVLLTMTAHFFPFPYPTCIIHHASITTRCVIMSINVCRLVVMTSSEGHPMAVVRTFAAEPHPLVKAFFVDKGYVVQISPFQQL